MALWHGVPLEGELAYHARVPYSVVSNDMVVDRLEIILSGVHLTEHLVECWHGFYARIIVTYGGSPSPMLLPFRQLWAPLPHLRHTMVGNLVRKHTVYVPGGTSLLFSYTFEAIGKEVQWFGGLPGAVQESALLLRPCAFRFLRVHEGIRGELPICPSDSLHYALIPAIVQLGAIFCSDHITRFGLLGLADQCTFDGDEPCVYATRMECLSVIIRSLCTMPTLCLATRDGATRWLKKRLS